MQIIGADHLFLYCAGVRGASHVRANRPCQDASYLYHNKETDVTILALADGHGSSSYDLSQYGSEIAVHAAIETMEKLYNHFSETEAMLYDNIRKSFPRMLISSWQDAVLSDIRRRDPSFYNANTENKHAIYKRYGTTLMTALLCPEGVFFAQIGDGNIILIDTENGIQNFTKNSPELFSNETYSLVSEGQSKLWNFNHWKTDSSTLIFLSTDGLYNCFADDEEFQIFPRSVFDNLLKTNTQAQRLDLVKLLPEHLREASEAGSGDDISVAFAFIDKETEPANHSAGEEETDVNE